MLRGFRNFANFILDIIPFLSLKIFDTLKRISKIILIGFLKKMKIINQKCYEMNGGNEQRKNKTNSIIAKTKSNSTIRKRTHFNINSTYFLLMDSYHFNNYHFKIQHHYVEIESFEVSRHTYNLNFIFFSTEYENFIFSI